MLMMTRMTVCSCLVAQASSGFKFSKVLLDSSELGPQSTVELAKWLNNECTGRH